jgi:hypothetical protein
MWIDMYPNCNNKTLPKKVNISALKPLKAQLRVIIFNTKNVKLHDYDFITKKYMSDIFVKGWLGEQTSQYQKTDTHNRSSTGEGNFNFRFIFDFEYLTGEQKIVTQSRGLFNMNSTIVKSDPILHLEVLDDEYIGCANTLGKLDLNLLDLLPKAQKPGNCKLIANDEKENVTNEKKKKKKINLFAIRKISGWWPFSDSSGNKLTVSSIRSYT